MSTTPTAPAKQPIYKKRWFLLTITALVALFVGVGIGSGSDVTTSPEYQEQAETLEQTETDLSAAEERIDELEADLEEIAGDLPAREQAVDEAEAALEKREADVKKAEKAVARREKAVSATENRIENNTVPGNGIFEVGVDIQPGTYKSGGSGGCYYSVNGDANGNNIISNNLTDGPTSVSVSAGQWFETQDCADWILQ